MNGDRMSLRDDVFAAVFRGEEGLLVELCRTYADAIVEQFDEWARVPEEYRADQRLVAQWGQALVTVAEVMQILGHSQPMERLAPRGTAHPFSKLRYLMHRAQQKHEDGEFAASSAVLHELLAEMAGWQGPSADDLRAKTYGMLGANSVRLDAIPEAVRYTERALQCCIETGDREGQWIYAENLEAVYTAQEIRLATPLGRRLMRYRERISYAQDLSDTRRYVASNDVLCELLDESDGAEADEEVGKRYLGKIYGLLGLNHFRLGALPEARRFTERALAECHLRGDLVGERIYAANLQGIR
ncbi:hypothetical protein AV521_31115 [Streptomyces sp. IMTB 2501]|uniref:hypothetical protein n=1 Tax=Streptomyces sp. IMTB 2501 TaxID=1776340 RepID=UPI00096DFB03|nr:hypothetical protein [Streptomyces sp. IMTB 2501]OLZ65520.1 hypothetical protein AV521_31115 [Streptomyces sp. IMTB 2501]